MCVKIFGVVVVEEFFPRADIAQSLDENAAAVVFDRFAVGIAGMIDPLRFVSTDAGIDHLCLIIQPELVRARIVKIFRNVRPQNAAPGVSDDEFAFPDRSGGENATAVDRRFLNLEKSRRSVAGIPGARPRLLFPSSFGHFCSNAEN